MYMLPPQKSTFFSYAQITGNMCTSCGERKEQARKSSCKRGDEC